MKEVAKGLLLYNMEIIYTYIGLSVTEYLVKGQLTISLCVCELVCHSPPHTWQKAGLFKVNFVIYIHLEVLNTIFYSLAHSPYENNDLPMNIMIIL